MNCGQCGAPCAVDLAPRWDPLQTSHRFDVVTVVAPGQKFPRARYFNALADVDFCSAGCSLAWHDARRQV